MLSERQKKILAKALQKSDSNILPEEDKLFKKNYPSGGLHRHDDDNPFGMHRHLLEDTIDGPHIHTVQNPGGEHAHGLLEGMALLDGRHNHEEGSLGWHHHKPEDDLNEIPIEKPGQVLPPNVTDVKEE